MKRCLICHYEDGDKSFTCPMCGEATWAEEQRDSAPDTVRPNGDMGEVVTSPSDPEPEEPAPMSPQPELALIPTEEAPKKRGPGRPKKDAS